jgi:DHA1 family tetracycline resistance protein-like MFS transporter
LLFLAVFGATMGQSIVFPILPPLGREMGLIELQIGLLITSAAALVVLVSPLWGRASDAGGRKPVLVAGMTGCTLGLYAFAVVTHFGLAGALSVPVLFALMLAARGVLFGASVAAIPVSSQAYVADVTTEERGRTKGIAALQAAQSLGIVLGPALGGLLAGLGALAPLYFAPTFVLMTAALVWMLLPAPKRRGEEQPSPRLSSLDGRVWPFLAVGLGLFMALSMTEITISFLYQDRLALPVRDAAQATGAGLFVAGLAILFVQSVLVPKLGWPPLRLIRAGIPVAAAGFIVLVFAHAFVTLTAGLSLVELGLGLAIPGYIAAPTLLVGRDEQGALAGLVGATNALTFVLGPAIGAALYQLRPESPYAASAALISLLFAFVFLHPGVRQATGSET